MGRFPVRRALTVLPVAALLGGLPAAAVADTGTPPVTTPSTTPTVPVTTPTTTAPVTTPTTTPVTTTPTTVPTTPTTPTKTTPAKPPKPKPKPKPTPPAHGTVSLHLGRLLTLSGQPVTVPGRRVAVSGQLRPYVPGVHVQLKAYVNGRLFKHLSVGLKRAASRRYESYAATLAAPSHGNVKVVVYRLRDKQLTAVKEDAHFTALDEDASFGATGPFVQLLQQRLAALHIYIPQTGTYDTGTGNAIDAYRRLIGWGHAQTIDPGLVTHILNGDGRFHVRYPDQGRHAEGDLSDQLLALIEGSNVQMIFPISSGKPSTPTILGSYQVYRKQPGYLPDGMYYSDFFIRGYAIHGYDPAPDYPASHGCMRLPIPDAITAYDWLALDDWVDTYYT